MIGHILLVAVRDYRQVVSTRGFKVTLLIVPLAIALSVFAAIRLAPQYAAAYVMVDASGRHAASVEQRLERDYQREVLRSLSAYAERWDLASADPAAPWARRGRARASDEALAQFVTDGGLGAAMRRLEPRVPRGVPRFKPPPRFFERVPAPAGVPTDRGAEAFGAAMAGPLQTTVTTPDGQRPLEIAIYIPQAYGAPGLAARVWTNGRPDPGLVNTLRQQLGADLRLEALRASGLGADAAARIEGLRAPVQVGDPSADGGGRNTTAFRSVAPLALVYLLLMTAITTGSLMLQSLVEERSNKLLESVLACIRAEALMYGKLLGLGAVGLTIAGVWTACAVGAAFLAPGFAADVLKPSLATVNDPLIVAAMIFYFLTGYLVVSMLFLTIGSLSDSIQDAQSYLTPVLVVIMLPVVFTVQAVARTPDAAFVHILSWIPLYTPFTMLARLGAGPPLLEVVGTAAVLLMFLCLELLLLGRLFRASLLAAGQPTRAEIFARMLTP
ncbi:MAG TPA: ABC transporter permease [Caulobacteraceae bacterium]|jgi:ABC-2 type transport system permease protein